MLTLFNTQELHIEISSKCMLKCPRCPRTELKPEVLNQEYTLEEFKTAFSSNTLSSVKKIIFCGDIGDPIYATEFLEIVEYVKQFKIQLVIVTNGSYKKDPWWAKLGSLLDYHDMVQFSVDGWDHDSNNMYRINSDYDSIINGIKVLRENSSCNINWSSIYFNFNEDHMDLIKAQATNAGVDQWQAVRSTKFDGRYSIDGQDPLKPKNYENQNFGTVYTKNITRISNRKKVGEIKYANNRHSWAKCLNWKKELFINVEGLVFPCPWFNSGYQFNDFVQKYKEKLNVRTRSLNEILDDELWEEFIVRLETMPLEICKIKCKNDR